MDAVVMVVPTCVHGAAWQQGSGVLTVHGESSTKRGAG